MVVCVLQSIWTGFDVCLAEQSVEAVVEARAEAEVGGAAEEGPVVILPRRREEALVLVVVGGRAEAVLLQGGQQSRLIFVH